MTTIVRVHALDAEPVPIDGLVRGLRADDGLIVSAWRSAFGRDGRIGLSRGDTVDDE